MKRHNEAAQCTKFLVNIDCFGTYNGEEEKNNKKIKTSTPGGCAFYDKLNIDLAGVKFIRWCIAVQNFRKFV